MLMKRLLAPFVIAVVVIACAQGSPGSAASGPNGDQIVLTGDQQADWAQITNLENEAKAIAKAEGCTSVAQCRTAAVGSRACGGPRYYLVYCSRTTDSTALFRKLEAVARAERDYNARYQIVSTCEFRMPPTVALNGGSCQASGMNGAPAQRILPAQ